MTRWCSSIVGGLYICYCICSGKFWSI